MRHAASVEAAAADHIYGEMDLVSQDKANTYHDMADEDAEPVVESSRAAPAVVSRGMDVDTALRFLANVDPAALRSIQTASDCADGGFLDT